MFDKIKRYYDLGIYKKCHLDKLLEVGAISQEQHEVILNDQ